ncbi:MAG: AAA family ATPase [Hyphomicrobiales bacterium]|nr:AAA family ATPase [Hyphomicrobiales bacterium]
MRASPRRRTLGPEWGASQLLQITPLHPIAEGGRLRFGVDAPANQLLADLEGTLRLVGLNPTEYASLLAPLVDISLPSDRETSFAPEELRRRQLAALFVWALASARAQPIVLAFEDLQWADPTSLDLLRLLAERGSQAPLLLLATTRPEFRPPWSLRSHHSLISLSPLDRAAGERMIGELPASHALSQEVVEGVNQRTGGVPLFVSSANVAASGAPSIVMRTSSTNAIVIEGDGDGSGGGMTNLRRVLSREACGEKVPIQRKIRQTCFQAHELMFTRSSTDSTPGAAQAARTATARS